MTQAVTDIAEYLDRHQKKELLRFLTCGSVDDGKSTLIGRLLHDTKGIYEDQLAAVKRDSARHGTTGAGTVDLALLTDGLKAEREQGITIDVAYRYFSTEKRKFIIADTPGHEQYTRNMATGASTCDLAIILIDARHGVMVQTRRHSFIVSLLGIRHVVVAINKMDLANYSQARFEEIKQEYAAFAKQLTGAGGNPFPEITFIPMSALAGDNVVTRSTKMDWYAGPCLLEHIETVPLRETRAGGGGDTLDEESLRFPVQLVLRPNLNFRGFAGTIAAGRVRVGEEIVALPSGKKSRIKAITTFDGDLAEASAPQAVTLVLADEIDISRGDVITHAPPHDTQPQQGRNIEAMLVWMHEKPLVPGRSYLLKQATRVTGAEVVEIQHVVDVNTLALRAPTGGEGGQLALNEVGRVILRTTQPLVFDPYAKNHTTGGLILIDRLTNGTVGAGMIIGAAAVAQTTTDLGTVSLEEKEKRLGQRGCILWIPHTQTAETVERALFERGRTVVRADLLADELTAESAGALARVLSQQGLICILSGPKMELNADLQKRVITCVSADSRGILQELAAKGILPIEESIAGEGI